MSGTCALPVEGVDDLNVSSTYPHMLFWLLTLPPNPPCLSVRLGEPLYISNIRKRQRSLLEINRFLRAFCRPFTKVVTAFCLLIKAVLDLVAGNLAVLHIQGKLIYVPRSVCLMAQLTISMYSSKAKFVNGRSSQLDKAILARMGTSKSGIRAWSDRCFIADHW